ncbi:MAG: hypothetical protein DRQ55_06310 [Planctomycetota bacterium]|nr:MAG: hypothetical protein DRQ55_06310 [Planctomycetota bacterium]
MKNMRIVGGLALIAALAMGPSLAAQTYSGVGPEYVGSDACKQCHEAKWNDHRVSGHPFKLHKRSEVDTWSVPLPSGYDWDDISYVIGGHSYKIRFMDLDGYIITESPTGEPGNNQYNIATGEWVDYHAGEVGKPYDCGSCHTTGFSPEGNQDGLEGIHGTWQFEGIQCEECHGAGGDHINAPSSANIILDDSAAACGACHVRGDPFTEIPAKGGYVKHHEQYNEFLASPHADLSCGSCHDAHKKSEFSITTQCVDCHEGYADVKKAFKGLGKKHVDFGLGCKDCHMPYMGKSAVAFNKYQGDVRSHLFDISTDKNDEPFTEDGSSATGVLTGEWVCLGCHENFRNKFAAADLKALAKGKPLKSVTWARKSLKKIHKPIKK